MFRAMRRAKQELSPKEIDHILYAGTSGVLAVSGDDDYPYAVPLSYFYDGSKLYFHCAKTGHKMDAIFKNPKASFCVVAEDNVVPEEYTTYYKSVIAFGQVRVIEDELQKLFAIRKLAEKYMPNGLKENMENAIAKEWSALCMLEMSIEHISGKEARELKKAREKI